MKAVKVFAATINVVLWTASSLSGKPVHASWAIDNVHGRCEGEAPFVEAALAAAAEHWQACDGCER